MGADRKKICFLTGTRADYGIMSRLIKALSQRPELDVQVLATNMHLSDRYGQTWREIERDGVSISRKVPMIVDSEDDSAESNVRAMGRELIGLSEAFGELKPDAVVILGDRYEMLAAASAAQIFSIPVIHLYGGETTEGANDDAMRHAITQLSTLHLTSTDEYRNRVVAMGAKPENAKCIGSLGVDNLLNEPTMPLDELSRWLGIELHEGFLLVTFHPVTRQPGQAAVQTEALLDALEVFAGDREIVFTMPNSDCGSAVIADKINEFVKRHNDKCVAVVSLGRRRYYSALKYCGCVVGNSSSGLIEAPSFGKPTVNIGNRQKGRARGNTVLDCDVSRAEIEHTIAFALSDDTQKRLRENPVNPYFHTDSLGEAVKAILEFLSHIP